MTHWHQLLSIFTKAPAGKTSVSTAFLSPTLEQFYFSSAFLEYFWKHPINGSHLKISAASSYSIQSTSDVSQCIRSTDWTLGSATTWAVCSLERTLCIHRAYPSNLSSLFRFLFVLLVLPELDHNDSGPIHLHRGILTISDHRYRNKS